MPEKINLYDLADAKSPDNETIAPVFYRIGNASELNSLNDLLNSVQGIVVHDTIHEQLIDLMRCQHPNLKTGGKEIEDAIFRHLDGQSLLHYGVWVYYPWSNKLVHLLDEEEFITVRTSRNNYKITHIEREILASKKVGVIGLSVGQSVSLAMAMERSFQELRIADFDVLDMSNLNRIRAGSHNIGLKKTVITAREIAEIDPYLKVTCFHDGINKDNIESFFLDGGCIDALIEECDSLEVKIMGRLVAKKLKVPVIMDTSDRGMVDIERFDLEPDRPIFHGMLSEFNTEQLVDPTKRMDIIYAILDKEQISGRFKYSIGEIGKTITTWPQLASAVFAGGAYAADIYRRTMLNMPIKSGRYYVDLDEIIK